MPYWGDAFSRSIASAWEWRNSHTYYFALFTIVYGAAFSALFSLLFDLGGGNKPRWAVWLERLGIFASSGVILTFCASVLVFLTSDPGELLKQIDEQRTALARTQAELDHIRWPLARPNAADPFYASTQAHLKRIKRDDFGIGRTKFDRAWLQDDTKAEAFNGARPATRQFGWGCGFDCDVSNIFKELLPSNEKQDSR